MLGSQPPLSKMCVGLLDHPAATPFKQLPPPWRQGTRHDGPPPTETPSPGGRPRQGTRVDISYFHVPACSAIPAKNRPFSSLSVDARPFDK